jgi:hypothetical protein
MLLMKSLMFDVLLFRLKVEMLGVSGKSVALPMYSGLPMTGFVELSMRLTVVPFALTLLRLLMSTLPSMPSPLSIDTEIEALLNRSALGALLLKRLAKENGDDPVYEMVSLPA